MKKLLVLFLAVSTALVAPALASPSEVGPLPDASVTVTDMQNTAARSTPTPAPSPSASPEVDATNADSAGGATTLETTHDAALSTST